MPRVRISSAVLILPLLTILTPLEAAPPQDARRWQKPAEVVEALKIRPGDSAALIGGSTYLIAEAAAAVGTSGKLYVIDSDRQVVASLQREIEAKKLNNTTAILATAADPLIPERLKLVIILNAYPYLDERRMFFTNLRKYLTPDGVVAVIDFYRRPMKVGPPLRERIASHRLLTEMKKFGFSFKRRLHILPYQYFLIFQKKK